jgi:hypothetical protein
VQCPPAGCVPGLQQQQQQERLQQQRVAGSSWKNMLENSRFKKEGAAHHTLIYIAWADGIAGDVV